MNKFALTTILMLTGCGVTPHDPIFGRWEKEGGCEEKEPYCSFTISSPVRGAAFYHIDFDYVDDDSRNEDRKIVREGGAYRYLENETSYGVMMYLFDGFLSGGEDTVRFKKVGPAF